MQGNTRGQALLRCTWAGAALALLAATQALASGTLLYNATNFVERWQNDGGVVTPLTIQQGTPVPYITVTLTNANDTFAGANGQDFVALGYVVPTNVPSGLTAVAIRAATNQVLLSLTGKAVSHTTAANSSNLSFTFTNSAFTSGSAASIVWASGSNLAVVFQTQNPSNWYVSATGSDANSGTSPATAFLTLSKAVSTAQSAANDVITIGTGTWTVADLALGAPARKPLTIVGAGKTLTILQATNAPLKAANKRIFLTDKPLILRQMTLQNANSTGSGGAIYTYGGFNGYLDWTFDSCRFLNNTATNTVASPAYGGAIYTFANNGAVLPWTAVNCDFIGNRADSGGAMSTYSQGIILTNCQFIGNQATINGGALWLNSGTTSLIANCQMLTNSAGQTGAVIYAQNSGPELLTACTFANNMAVGVGGAIYKRATVGFPVMLVSNSTFYGNAAGLGGAVCCQNNQGFAGAFYNSTFANNTAQTGGAIRADSAGSSVGIC